MKYALWSLFLTVSTLSFASLQECPSPAQNQRDLIIMADIPQEESTGFANKAGPIKLKAALTAQIAPILIELSLWKRVAQEIKSEGDLEKWFRELSFEFYQFKNYMLAIPDQWKKTFAITDTGFNLAHYTKVLDPLSMQPTIVIERAKGILSATLAEYGIYSSLVYVLRELLVFKDRPTEYTWNILLSGHGGAACFQHYIAGMPYNEFKKLLHFLERDIKTNIFLYRTCYAGGQSSLKVYETDGRPDQYSFPIILTDITESVTLTRAGKLPNDYQEFFTKIRTIALCPSNQHELGVAASLLLGLFSHIGENLYTFELNNTLQIRWPGHKKFNYTSPTLM